MVVIGLTGGIASGKSTVSRILRELGAPVVDADAIVHQLQVPGSPVLAAIARAFGPGVIREDGSLDRAALGRIIFADPARRQALEAIMHPAVRQEMWAQVEQYRQQGEPAVVLDVPLLVETGLYKQVDQVWVVYVDPETQLVRLMTRDGLDRPSASLRVAAQMSLEAKRSLADLVIDNRGSEDSTRSQVIAAWRQVAAGPPSA